MARKTVTSINASCRAFKRRGGMCLEAAIIMPVVLMLITTLVSFLISIEMEIKLKGAMDRTAAELSLLSPLCDWLDQSDVDHSLTDCSQSALLSEIETLSSGLFSSSSMRQLAKDAALDLFSSALLGQFIQQRINYWLNEVQSSQPYRSDLLSNRHLYLDWQLERQQLWLCMSYQLNTPVGKFKRQTNLVVPLWIGAGSQLDDESADQIWLMDNFSRGQRLRHEFGGNLPCDFPVIARFSGGEAVSIKSIDLTAPTYQSPNAFIDRLKSQIDLLASFQGSVYRKLDQTIKISAESIESRKLLLIIPDNCKQLWLESTFSQLEREALSRSVTLQMIRFGNSTRYQNNAESVTN